MTPKAQTIGRRAEQKALGAHPELTLKPPRNHQPIEVLNVPGALLKKCTVSAVTGLSAATIDRKTAAGELPSIKMGKRCTRWKSDDVRAFLARVGGNDLAGQP